MVPKDRRKSLIRLYHEDVRSGHVGAYKTYWKLHHRYHWPKMRCDVAQVVRRCQVCAKIKPEQKAPAGLMGKRPDIRYPWQMISMDYMGPFPRSTNGYSYLLVISDYFSKFVLLQPFRTAHAKSLVKFLEDQIFLVFGVPQFLVCDNGPQMRSNLVRSLCDKYHSTLSFTPNYYPRADPVERYNRIIKTMIRSYIKDDHRKWDEHLSAIGCAIRSSRSETTGCTPHFINFGREHVRDGLEYKHRLDQDAAPTETDTFVQKRIAGYQQLFDRVKRRLVSAEDHNRRVYNLRRRHLEFRAGDRVWRRNKAQSDATRAFAAKLAPTYVGPFTVKRKIGYCTYELVDDGGVSSGVWHVQDLKLAQPPPPT